MKENLEDDAERTKTQTLHVFEVDDQALIYTRNPGEYKHDPCRRDLFHGSVSQ